MSLIVNSVNLLCFQELNHEIVYMRQCQWLGVICPSWLRLDKVNVSLNLGKAAALPALPLITNVWSPIPILSNCPLIHRFLDSSLLFCAVALKLSLLSPSRVSTNCWSRSHYTNVTRWAISMEQELRFGLVFGQLAILRKNLTDYEQFLRAVFSRFFFKYSCCIKWG